MHSAKKTGATADRGDSRRIMDALRLLVRELRAAAAASERATGLSGAQLFVLRLLAREPGLGVAGLAERTHTHQSSVSVVVSKLEERGLVARARADGDARRLLLRPTAAGRRAVGRGPDSAQERLLAALGRLPPATRRRLADDLGRWISALGLDGRVPEMFFESTAGG